MRCSSGAEPGSRAPALRAVAVARPGPRGLRIRGVCAARDRPARGATARCAREQDRRRSRSVGTSTSWASCKDCSSSTAAPSACAASSCSRSIDPAGRPRRWRHTGTADRCSSRTRHRSRPGVAGARRGDPPSGSAARRAGRRAGSAAVSACDSRRRGERRDARRTARGRRAARRALGELILIVLEQDGERLGDATRLAHERMESLAENGRAVRAAAFVTTTPGDDVVRSPPNRTSTSSSSTPLANRGRAQRELATVLEGAPAMSACSSREANPPRSVPAGP